MTLRKTLAAALAALALSASWGAGTASAEDEYEDEAPPPFPVTLGDRLECSSAVLERLCPIIVCVGAGSASTFVRMCPDVAD